MKRRQALAAMAAAAMPFAVRAQTSAPRHRIGVLLTTSRTRPNIERLLVPFDQALRELGYVEGRNLLIDWAEAEGRLERLPVLAAGLLARKVELIVAGANEAAMAAKKATAAVPIVFVASGDPVGMGLVKTLAKPGGNVTGFSTLSTEYTRKQLELLREVLPHARRVAVIQSPGDSASVPQLAAMREATALLGLDAEVYDVANAQGLEPAFQAIHRSRPDAMHVFFTVATYLQRERIADFAAAARLPAVYGYVECVEAGGLMSYGFSYADNWRRTAAYVDRILKGERPADLPVQQPTALELAINLKAAQALGLRMPQTVLVRADRIIQ